MRLGMTSATYQWLFAGDGSMFTDRQGAKYDWRGLPMPYFLSTPVTITPADRDEWQINRSKELGLSVVHGSITNWQENRVNLIKSLLKANNQELIPSIGGNLLLTGQELTDEVQRVNSVIEQYHRFGDIRLMKFCISPMVYNRFRRDIPLQLQLERITEGIKPIVEAAERADIVLAFENHLDYRASEIAQIIQRIGSPHLRFLFDTGNPFSVCEDPVDAARVAAPYTVLIHVKDVRVVPWTPASPGYFACMYACPLGEGNVDLLKIFDILRDCAPDLQSMPASIEVTPIPPYQDEDHWFECAVKWMRTHAVEYLN